MRLCGRGRRLLALGVCRLQLLSILLNIRCLAENKLTFDLAGNRVQLKAMEFRIEFDREDDGRWVADIPALPGVLAYGETQEEAKAKAEALALRVVADRIEESKKAVPSVVFA